MVVEVMNVYVALDLLTKAVREAREERGPFSARISPQAKHEYKNDHGFGDLSQQSEGRNYFPYRP